MDLDEGAIDELLHGVAFVLHGGGDAFGDAVVFLGL